MTRDTESQSKREDAEVRSELNGSEHAATAVAGLELPVLTTPTPADAPEAGEPLDENTERPRIELAELRSKLEQQHGKEYWRSLNQLAETDEFADMLRHEFPAEGDQILDPVSRRSFMKVMGASMALAGLGACVSQPEEKIVPYVKAPEEFVPGKPLFFATAMPHAGYGIGLLAESHLGRPTKLEGNPDHPASLGATDIFAQASILQLYDPDRSQSVIERGEISTWSSFLVALANQLDQQTPGGGAGLRILTETITSPTLAEQMRGLLAKFPGARWYQYEPVGRDNTREGSRLATGGYTEAIYDFNRADVILSLDADFLHAMPGSVRYAREFARRRKVEEGAPNLNRLYVAEASPTITGAMADHHFPIRSSRIEAFARAVATALGVAGAGGAQGLSPEETKWADAVATDLRSKGARSLVIAGEYQPPAVHALAHAMNQTLGSAGTLVRSVAPIEASPMNQIAGLRELVADMQQKRVQTLIILGGNPVYTAPADLGFAAALDAVPFRAHLSMYQDETSRLCHWHVPESHFLEMWSDVRAFDGTVSIIQPLISPLYSTKSAHDVLDAMAARTGRSDFDIVRDYWSTRLGGDPEGGWQAALHDGLIASTRAADRGSMRITESSRYRIRGNDTAFAHLTAAAPITGAAAMPAPRTGADTTAARDTAAGTTTPRPVTPGTIPPPTQQGATGGLEINFRPDPTIYDGRFANNGWLQELPKPLTKLTWDNAVLISPATAERLGLGNNDEVELRLGNQAAKGAIWITPGHAPDSVTVTLGYGRQRAGRIGNGTGFNAYVLRTSGAPWFSEGLEMAATGDSYSLASTQDHWSMEGRDLVRSGSIADYQKDPSLQAAGHHGAHARISLYPQYEYSGYAWGMAIDLNSCIGCNACTIACQAENNIPVVGKDAVLVGREMHWIRIDRYFSGTVDNPETYFQPLPCMHCETAPCEVVCPVAATVHSAEGLNDMVYNRCIGTRYCANNCPYKVRRFNFLDFTSQTTPSQKLGNNPDVTVRSRGVMEKCTYCVQRINHARIEAKKQDRKINDGEIETACQAVCPTEAIVFGDINDKESRVAKLKAQPRNYGLLTELNTEPRTTYLGRVRNPNPVLVQAPVAAEAPAH